MANIRETEFDTLIHSIKDIKDIEQTKRFLEELTLKIRIVLRALNKAIDDAT